MYTEISTRNPLYRCAYYSATVMYMGRWASYPARIMMQFVFTDALKNAISPSSITEAKLYLWDQSTDTTRRTVNVRIPRNIWTASTVTWNTAPSYYTGTWNGIPAPTSHTISGDPGWWAFPYMKDVVAAMLRNYIDTSLAQTIHEKRGIMIKLADETVGLKTFRTSNHSENRPNMSITYTASQPYGAAWAHRQLSASSGLNCWGFALGKNTSIETVFWRSGALTLSDIDLANLFGNYSVQNNYVSSMRLINSATAQIDSNEFRVAFRGKKTYVYNSSTLRYELYIYHFMVQTNTGGWSHKPSVGTHVGGQAINRASVNEGNINPSSNGSYWLNWVSLPDSSSTMYFAVKN